MAETIEQVFRLITRMNNIYETLYNKLADRVTKNTQGDLVMQILERLDQQLYGTMRREIANHLWEQRNYGQSRRQVDDRE